MQAQHPQHHRHLFVTVERRDEWRRQIRQAIDQQAHRHAEPEQRVQIILADFLALDNRRAEAQFVEKIHQPGVNTAHAKQPVIFRHQHACHGDRQHPAQELDDRARSAVPNNTVDGFVF
jgi:hypothetical protein